MTNWDYNLDPPCGHARCLCLGECEHCGQPLCDHSEDADAMKCECRYCLTCKALLPAEYDGDVCGKCDAKTAEARQ